MPTLTQEFVLRATLARDDVGAGPYGERTVFTLSDGEIIGERLNGRLVGAGADWVLRGADGFGHVDARYTIRTSDGALIYVQHAGVVERTPEIRAVVGGADRDTGFGDQYWFTCARLETGHDRYAWVNRTIFISQGRLLRGPVVEHRVYRLDND
jgi:hypothetical protein